MLLSCCCTVVFLVMRDGVLDGEGEGAGIGDSIVAIFGGACLRRDGVAMTLEMVG